jgi:hypothetical protein
MQVVDVFLSPRVNLCTWSDLEQLIVPIPSLSIAVPAQGSSQL